MEEIAVPEGATAPPGREMKRATRKALAFLRDPVAHDYDPLDKAQNVWDESQHPRDARGHFGQGASVPGKMTGDVYHRKLGMTFGPRKVITGRALKAALPAGAKSYEGVPLASIREVHLTSQSEFRATGCHVLVYKQNPQTREPADKPTYIYSTKHAQESADKKFAKAAILARGGHSQIVNAYKRDLASKDEATRARAAVVGLIDATTMRVGGSDSEEKTGSVGATTMRAEHVTKVPGGLRFKFPGKSGKEWNRVVKDASLVRAISGFLAGAKRGQEVFPVSNNHINDYLADKVKGTKVTAKDLRTFHATADARARFKAEPAPKSEKEARETVKAIVEAVSDHLGNTPKVCQDKYVDPRIISDYLGRTRGKG